jgi:hypothetical protein
MHVWRIKGCNILILTQDLHMSIAYDSSSFEEA